MQYRTPYSPAVDVEMQSDDFKILGAAKRLRGMSPILPPSINMPDRDGSRSRSLTTRRPLPVFTSSYGFRRTPASFLPELNSRAFRLSEKVSKRGRYSSPLLPRPVFSWTYGFSVLPTDVVDPTPPIHDSSPYAERDWMDDQYDELMASINGYDVYGRGLLPSEQATGGAIERKDRRMEIGTILNDQPSRPDKWQINPREIKREGEVNEARPAKRARHNKRPHFDMMSVVPRPGKKFYSGPSLNRACLNQQESYKPLKRLGTGGEGTAHLLKNRRSGSVVVCKVIPHRKAHNYYESELFFLRDALPRHDRILNLRSALVSPIQAQLYLDYCNGGDLASFIEGYHYKLMDASIPEAFIWHTFLQLTEALAFIHHGYDRSAPSSSDRPMLPDQWLPVIHRDIKPANILLQRAPFNPDHPGIEPYPRLVLADFGLALQATEYNTFPTSDYGIGTVGYQAPECPHHSTKGDVFSLGATVFEMCTSKLPFDREMPEWVTDTAAFWEWINSLPDSEVEGMFSLGWWDYSEELERCLRGALAMDMEWRLGSLELMRRVDCGKAPWVELNPWAFEMGWDGEELAVGF